MVFFLKKASDIMFIPMKQMNEFDVEDILRESNKARIFIMMFRHGETRHHQHALEDPTAAKFCRTKLLFQRCNLVG